MDTGTGQHVVPRTEQMDQAERDRAAFLQLYRRHYDDVFRYCMRRLFDRHAAEDMTAEVFLKIIEHFHRSKGNEQQLRCWIHRIAANAINSHLRKTLRRRDLLQRFVEPHRCDTTEPMAPSDGTIDKLKDAMLSLKPRHQAIITLRFFQNLRSKEIAQTLGCSPGTARSQLARAVAQLHRKLTAAGVFGPGGDRHE